MSPDEAVFRDHIEDAPFQAGVDISKWGFHGGTAEIIWPHPIFWVGADADLISGGRVFLRFTTDGYPQAAPTACPWDIERNSRLDPALWPTGPGSVAKVFNPNWNNGVALYAPCDRLAMSGHESWKTQFPSVWWGQSSTIVVYLEFVHSCLNRRKYSIG